MTVLAAFFGGPWADEVRELNQLTRRISVPLVRAAVAPGPLEPLVTFSVFVYERRGEASYYPARSRF